jgi:hypothetical protein
MAEYWVYPTYSYPRLSILSFDGAARRTKKGRNLLPQSPEGDYQNLRMELWNDFVGIKSVVIVGDSRRGAWPNGAVALQLVKQLLWLGD